MANDSLIGPKRNGARWFAVAGVGSIAALIALAVASQRTTLISAEKVLLSSSPVWVALGVGGSAAFLALLVATQFSAQNMVGLDPSYRMLVRPSLEAHMLNQVTKSNALAGLVAFNRDARERGQARGSVVAGYLLAGVAEQFGFALVASVAFVVIISTGSLTTADIIAGLTFVVYLVLTVVVFAAALRSRESIRAVHGWLHRLRVLGRSGPIDHTRADEFYESVDILRRRPFAALYVMVPAIGADLCLVGLLAVALEAVGAPVSVGLVLVTYAVSTLFGIVGFLPSGIGFVEVSAAAALVSGGVDPAQAAAAVGLYRLADSWLPLLAGIAASGERLPRRWWASLRAGAAALALLGGGVGFIVAVGGGGIRRMPVRHLAVGVFRTERFLVALCAVALCTLVPALWRGKSWAAAVAVLLTVLLLRGAHQYRPELALIAAAICAVIGFGQRNSQDLWIG